jgi:PTH1 family peptidyl-tRNA hydrolase
MTYMNESGQVLAKLKRMFDFNLARMLVIYDDIDLPLGRIRIRERGSAGSHKGMKSIVQHGGTQEFPRLRIGIRPPQHPVSDVVHYVLTALRGEKFAAFTQGVQQAADAALAILDSDIQRTMNMYNRRKDSLLLPGGRG